MKNINGDMAAMPTQSNGGDIYGGMTRRDMIAMHALNGLMVSYESGDVAMGGESLVRDAVWYADALLAELERTK